VLPVYAIVGRELAPEVVKPVSVTVATLAQEFAACVPEEIASDPPVTPPALDAIPTCVPITAVDALIIVPEVTV
jgi:hypothetical protein